MQDCQMPPRSDDGSAEGGAFVERCNVLIKAGERRGRPFCTEPENYKQYMEDVGFVDIQVEEKVWPFGPWMEEPRMKEIGLWSRANFIDGFEAIDRAEAANGGERSKETVDAEHEAMVQDLMNPEVHCYVPVYFVSGKKPKV